MRKRNSTSREVNAQLSLFRQQGGARKGAGRPKPNGRVLHRARPKLSRHHPVHVTLRLAQGLESLRNKRIFSPIRTALRAARERFGFRLVQFSVQSNHLHLLVEAEDRTALTRGMQGLAIRVSLAVNRVLARRGRVFAERYHARALRSPLEVRRALLYVLKNRQHHLAARGASLPPWHLDPCSSALGFRDWQPGELLCLAQHGASRPAPEPCTVCARTFLLRSGWRRHGLLRLDENPA